MDTILVVNAGSSSVKFQIFGIDGERGLMRLIKGQMDGIGTRPRLRAAGDPRGAPGAGYVLDHDLLAERLRHVLADDARHDVGGAAGRERDD